MCGFKVYAIGTRLLTQKGYKYAKDRQAYEFLSHWKKKKISVNTEKTSNEG